MLITDKILSVTGSIIWGTPMVMLFLFTAVRFTLKSRFFQLRCPKKLFKNTFATIFKKGSADGISPFNAFCSVLGACLGTGNIVGVATAIYSGGPGTVFWMWLSAIFSSMTAYSESFLGAKYTLITKNKSIQGVYAYIELGFKSKATAIIYGFFALSSAIGMGNITQSNSLAQALKTGFEVPPLLSGIVVALLCGFILFGGLTRIARTQTILVPIMTLSYITVCFLVTVKFKHNLLPCITLIFKEAFAPKALSGYGIYKATRYGISRGVFSNEAGLGSATLLHSSSNNPHPQTQGMWAIIEVFVDTVIMCTVTAIVILVSCADYKKLFGAELSIVAFSSIGNLSGKFISLLTAVFAFTSLTSCSFYGEQALIYISGKSNKILYRIIYIIIVFIGCINPPRTVWAFADICNGLMAIPNLFVINVLSEEVEYP